MLFTPNPKRHQRQLQISERKVLIALGDITAVFAAVLLALRLWTVVAGYEFTLDFVVGQSSWFIVLAGLWLLLARANDFYDLPLAANWSRSLQRLLVITAQMIVVYVLVFFVSPRDALPRLFILYYGVASFVFISIWRFTRPALLGWASHPRRMLIVGTDWSAEVMVEAIREFASHEYDVRGIIGSTDDVGHMVSNIPVIGSGADMMNFVYRDQISEIVITGTQQVSGETFQAVMDAYERGVVIVPMTLLYESITGRVPVEHVNNDWAVVFLPMKNTNAIFDPYPFLKRLMDIAFALFGLLCFGILFPIIVLAIRLDSQGSIFYTQERLGRNGKAFRVYKLRSMVTDAEATTGAVFSQRGDPRVTRVGRFFRKTRLDEVPQLVNVLKGDMSLIGPRPERPEHVQRLTQKIPFYRTRLIVRPGLTGWAQVRYDYGSNDDDALVKLQYDLYYIRHHSLMLDANILVRTVGKVLTMSGV